MRKLLLLAVLLTLGAGAKAEVTETDLSQYNDVMYAAPITVLQGTTSVRLPINVKAHADFVATESMLVLPAGVEVIRDGGADESRYDTNQNVQLVTFLGNQQTEGYKLASVIVSSGLGTDKDTQYGFTAGDGVLGYIEVDVSALEVGEYAMVMKNALISKFLDGSADVTIIDEIVTKLIISSELVFDEMATALPLFTDGISVNATVNRTIKAGQWSTIVLPFTLSGKTKLEDAFGEGVELATFDHFETEFDDDLVPQKIQMKFKSVTMSNLAAISAGVPCLIKTTKDISSFEVSSVKLGSQIKKVEKSDSEYDIVTGVFTGSFVPTVIPAYGLFISGNKFYYSKGATNTKGLRGWFELSAVLGNQFEVESKIRFDIDGEATSIDGISEITKVANGVYSVTGAKVSEDSLDGLPAGVYIVNGKKVYKK